MVYKEKRPSFDKRSFFKRIRDQRYLNKMINDVNQSVGLSGTTYYLKDKSVSKE